MTGSIQNRDEFLTQIATSLGRDSWMKNAPVRNWQHQPQHLVLKDATVDELVDVLRLQCEKIHTTLVETNSKELEKTLKETVANHGGGPIVSWKDERFSKWGLSPLINEIWPNEGISFHEWDYTKEMENISFAEKANVGITISEITLAESGTVVLLSDKDKGRTVSFLPATLIVLVPKSTLVPRMTQAAQKLRSIHEQGNLVASCVNFITGPSNSADIELNLVVGVHGPVKASYILIDDL
ncbi:LutC/YkgG family protein [Robertmurraya korlensis]|uniref:LutC/YkgG family protein n=1 Tax=Robertmurraya korlensis TaxID=519977 RepID=UPI000825071F|nr:lactate utilization protein C [Robertmurraya korlensis]